QSSPTGDEMLALDRRFVRVALTRVSVNRPAGLVGVQQYRAEHWTSPRRLITETFMIVSVVDGASHVRYRGKTHVDVPGTLALVEPGEVCKQVHVPRPETIEALMLDAQVLDDLVRDAPRSKRTTLHFKHVTLKQPRLYDAFTRLNSSLRSDWATPLERQ